MGRRQPSQAQVRAAEQLPLRELPGAQDRPLGDPLFHPSSRVNFRQRLDSTQMFGRVARMSRLDCVRESLRLALQELEGMTPREARPVCWSVLWER